MAKRGIEVAPPRAEAPRTGPRRTRVVIKRVGPLSVLRWSLFFYFCIFLIFFFATWFIYGVLDTSGILTRVGDFLGSLSLGTCTPGTTSSASTCVFTFDQGWIFSRLFVFGIIVVLVWSTITVLVSFLYNLVSDVIGGIELTLVERR